VSRQSDINKAALLGMIPRIISANAKGLDDKALKKLIAEHEALRAKAEKRIPRNLRLVGKT